MAKRGRKKKKIKSNISIIIMMISSILLGVLIYNQSGTIGQKISPILSGVMGFIKYILPIGIFLIAIYKLCNKKEDAYIKLFQYALLLICVAVFMHIVYLPQDAIQLSNGFSDTVARAYEQGKTDDKVGGIIGAVGAIPLTKLLGKVGAAILVLGVELVLIILIFNINPIEEIRERLAEREERKQEEEKERIKEEKRLREKEEQRRAAMELDEQITINLNDDDKKKKEEGYIEENLFKKEQEQKQEKVKEVLQLEHALTVEDEHYEFPPVQLLSEGEKKAIKGGKKAVTDTASKLQKTLYSFGVSAKVENVSVGPAITRYELKPAEGVRVSKIANLADDIALNLAAESIRIEAPIPGKQAVGIEIPNKENEIVHLRDIIDCPKFTEHKSKLAFALGKDVAGEEVVTDISKMPHVLIAGATGSGKSVCINTLIASIIYKAKPSEVKLVMVDPKVVELSVYNGIPHLLIPVVTDPKKAAGALSWAVQEMENRYSLFANKNVRDIKGYNEELDKEGSKEKLPQIVIIIDELADLMMVSSKDVEDSICRLAQKARAAGMHLVIATQRPSVDVITGIIKANIPSRISFAVSSQVDSRTILDMAGAEKLLGKGDMLFYPAGATKPTRVQGAFISDKEVEKVVDFVKANGEATYNDDILEQIERVNSTDKEIEEQQNDDSVDPLLMEAIDVVVETGQASTSFIQRRFKVGYARAGRIIDQMEERGIISGFQGSKPREVLMSKERWQELKTTSYTEME